MAFFLFLLIEETSGNYRWYLGPSLTSVCRGWDVSFLGHPTKQNRRLSDVLRTMREKDNEILALSELRWPGHGVSDLNEEVIVHSGMEASANSMGIVG